MERFGTGSAGTAGAGPAGTAAPLRTVVFLAAAEAAARFAPAAVAALVVAAGAVVMTVRPGLDVRASVFPSVFRALGSAMMGNPHMQNGRAAGAAHSE